MPLPTLATSSTLTRVAPRACWCFGRVDDGWHFMLGAGLTSVAVLLEQPKRVSELMLFCMSRAVEICWTLLERRGMVRDATSAPMCQG